MNLNKNQVFSSLYELPVQTVEGKSISLEAYRGKVLLIVNVASRCGFTPQYSALEKLYQSYKKEQFALLAFPCNQFLKQEPASNADIKHFAKSCYQVHFPLFAKIAVKGPEQAPLYRYLEQNLQKKPLIFIPWNFTKILVNAEGQPLKQYLPFTSLQKIEKKLQALLPR